MEFNSLDAQREAALAYIQSQKHEGWILVGDRYDDGGFSGGTMERPALQRLLRDVESGGSTSSSSTRWTGSAARSRTSPRIVEVFEKQQSLVRQHNAAIQHDDFDGPADAQHSALASRSSSAR